MEKYLRPERFDVEPTSASADKEWLHWKKTFENFLSHMKDATAADNATYTGALSALEALYVKPKNVIYARHCLATRQQNTGETVDQYLQVLKHISKDCKFEPVTAQLYKEEYIRDAFISGLSSARIRQRLLENTTLTLDEAFNQARA
ncbi:hypothetical protein M8J77_015726 [Diaphorina citri]|nr:hypothetical protein M8J77_015726 [Diaphorina citri]